MLDYNINELVCNRKVYLWGTGSTVEWLNVKESLERWNIEIHGYLDGNIDKKGSIYNGKKVLHISEIPDKTGAFIVISHVYLDEATGNHYVK